MVLTVMGVSKSPSKCGTVGIQGIAWASLGTAIIYDSPYGWHGHVSLDIYHRHAHTNGAY
jgi:aquaporin PIP